ncbi:MAG TPA: SDR family oxidoreductase [Dehalococcoidia bacterium]|nr:SDR family oxidoreductase [Dehalococcoidia bacterium]
MKLADRAALVAGGGQGIGEGIVKCLAEEGANIAVADINGDNAGKVADAVKAMGRKALAIKADLTNDDEVTRTVKETVDFFGKIDILVNCVGGVSRETVELMIADMAEARDEPLPQFLSFGSEVWDRYYRLNLKSHVMLSHAVTPHFMKQKSGKIVNISSDAGRLPDTGQMPYGAMKAGDISITWSLARALAPYNVTVNCICPGFVYTPLWEMGAAVRLEQARSTAKDIEELSPYEFWLKYIVLPGTPLGREQTPEDMGRAVVFFVSEDAKNVTGQVLHVNGGTVMR